MVKKSLNVVYFDVSQFYIWTVIELPNASFLGVANVYIPPDSSKYIRSFEPVLESLLEAQHALQLRFPKCSDWFLMGDFNARIGKSYHPITEYQVSCNARTDCIADSSLNARGKILLAQMHANIFQLLNGVVSEDYYTRFDKNYGNSTLDYVWWQSGPSSVFQIVDFHIDTSISLDLDFSDHAALSLLLSFSSSTVEQQKYSNVATATNNAMLQPIRDVSILADLNNYVDWSPMIDAALKYRSSSEYNATGLLRQFEQFLATNIQSVTQECAFSTQQRSKPYFKYANQQHKPRQAWFDYECQQARKGVFALRRKYYAHHPCVKYAMYVYRDLLRAKKAAFVAHIEQYRISEPRAFYQLLKVTASPNTISNDSLRQHYRSLLTDKGCTIQQEIMPESLAAAPVFDEFGIKEAISRLKNHKAAFPSFFSPALLKYFVNGDTGSQFAQCLSEIFNTFAMCGLPLEWNKLMITSLYKAGDKYIPSNYRGLSVMQCLPKVYSLALNELLTTAADTAEARAPIQAGFRRKYRVEDNALLLRMVFQKCKYMRCSLHCLFLDIKKAYDSVNRAELWRVLTEQLPQTPDIISCIKQLYVDLAAFLKGDPHTPLYQILIQIGVKQGCPLSPLLFAIFFDRLYSYVRTCLDQEGRGAHRDLVDFLSLQLFMLMFADDVVIMATSQERLQQLFGYVQAFCTTQALMISEPKTKYMICGPQAANYRPGTDVFFGSHYFAIVQDFRYLGLHFDQFASSKHMISFLLTKAKRVFFWLLKFVTTQHWTAPHTRLVLLNVYVRTLLQFGAPVWAPDLLDVAISREHPILRPMLVQQRRGIRTLLGVDSRLHNVLLMAASNQIPLQATLLKMVWRYFSRIDATATVTDSAQGYLALNEVAKWTLGHDEGHKFVMHAGLSIYSSFPNEAAIYKEDLQVLQSQVQGLSDLSFSVQRVFWCDVLRLTHSSLGFQAQVPAGYTASTWLQVAPGGHFKPITDEAAGNATKIELLRKPAWLLGPPTSIHKLLSLWYYDTSWLTSEMLGPPDNFLECDDLLWTPYEAHLISFMNVNSIAIAMWAYFPQMYRIFWKCRQFALSTSDSTSISTD